MSNAGAGEKAAGRDRDRRPRLEIAERGVERAERDAEIGDSHFILERTRRPADRRRRLVRNQHVREEGPQRLHAERKDEEIAEQLVEDDAPGRWPRASPDRETCAEERSTPHHHRDHQNDQIPDLLVAPLTEVRHPFPPARRSALRSLWVPSTRSPAGLRRGQTAPRALYDVWRRRPRACRDSAQRNQARPS